ncbi:MAG: YcaQ family DNA glycosylase [Elusimicrobia bacterium]|nr:YcaQ family DNA glycosylase [Elusimicrobiota bacterium]
MKVFPRRAAAALFLRRQHLERPRAVPLSARALSRFAEDAGGVQLDSINVVERAHRLTLWSRFGAYDRAALDALLYERRLLFEYWAHAACLVPRAHLPAWKRAMLDYKTKHTGWSVWLKKHGRTVKTVEAAVREKGPITGGHFERPLGAKPGQGWWDWKPATHALHYLWMTGRIGVHGRVNFQKHWDLSERLLPEVAPLSSEEFRRWHLRASLRAMGAASQKDLSMYMTFPKLPPADRKRALSSLIKEGTVVEIRLEGSAAPWYALSADLLELEALAAGVTHGGTTFLSPFDSLLWHRARAIELFGFDYKIEVYTPGPKRRYGYYVLPILHDGKLVGRLDPKLHREEGRLEVRQYHLEKGTDAEAVAAGGAEALASLARFLGAKTVDVTAPGAAAAKLKKRNIKA